MENENPRRYVYGMSVPVHLIGGPLDGEQYVLIPMGAWAIPARLSFFSRTVWEIYEQSKVCTWSGLPRDGRIEPLRYEYAGHAPLIGGNLDAVVDAGQAMRWFMDQDAKAFPLSTVADSDRAKFAAGRAWDCAAAGKPFPSDVCEWRRPDDGVCLHRRNPWKPCARETCPYPARREVDYLWPHEMGRESCPWAAAGKIGECPTCGLRVYVEGGERKTSNVDPAVRFASLSRCAARDERLRARVRLLGRSLAERRPRGSVRAVSGESASQGTGKGIRAWGLMALHDGPPMALRRCGVGGATAKCEKTRRVDPCGRPHERQRWRGDHR